MRHRPHVRAHRIFDRPTHTFQAGERARSALLEPSADHVANSVRIDESSARRAPLTSPARAKTHCAVTPLASPRSPEFSVANSLHGTNTPHRIAANKTANPP